MAELFAKAYQHVPFQSIYCSPLKRTQQTAKPISDLLGIKPILKDGLKEISYGKWEGKSSHEVDEEFHDDYLRWISDPAWNAPTDGERAVTIARRAVEVVDEIKETVPKGKVLVVSHKATIRILICSLLGIDVGRYRYRLGCPVSSVSVIEFAKHGPLLHALADRMHLNRELRELPGT